MHLAQHKKTHPTPSNDAPLPHRIYATVFNQLRAETLYFPSQVGSCLHEKGHFTRDGQNFSSQPVKAGDT